MPEQKKSAVPDAAQRIIASASNLIAQHGYNAVTTRAIASQAQVNEVTIFRHYPKKHDLNLAVMKSGLQQLHFRGELLAEIAEASDGRQALLRTLDLITDTLTAKPEIVRLLQFGALELSTEFNPLARRHLNELVEMAAHYLDPWLEKGELRCASSKDLVFTLIAIVISCGSLQRIFSAEGLTPTGMFEACANLICM